MMAQLTLDKASEIVREALRKGREMELQPLSVAVLDSGGHLKAFSREDGAGILRPQICFRGQRWESGPGPGFSRRGPSRGRDIWPSSSLSVLSPGDGWCRRQGVF